MEYNTEKAISGQREFCENNNFPTFYPKDGVCWGCKKDIFSPDGFSVEDAKYFLITFCPFCHKSFLD